MAISETTGTQDIAAADAEHSLMNDSTTLATTTDDGVVQAFLDVNDMGVGDQLRVRVYEKTRSSDTQRVVYEAILTGVQAQPVFVTPALTLMHGWDFSIDSLAGTITVHWSIRRIPVA